MILKYQSGERTISPKHTEICNRQIIQQRDLTRSFLFHITKYVSVTTRLEKERKKPCVTRLERFRILRNIFSSNYIFFNN
jgi:hypothetical protein